MGSEVQEFPDWMKDTPQNRKYFNKIKEAIEPNIKQGIDGFYYFMIDVKGISGGLMSSNDLKCIVFILEKLNGSYQKDIEEYFKRERNI